MVLQYMKEETLPYALMQDVLLPDQRAIYRIKTNLLVTTGSVRSPEQNRITE
jgi:hypothetical protein